MRLRPAPESDDSGLRLNAETPDSPRTNGHLEAPSRSLLSTSPLEVHCDNTWVASRSWLAEVTSTVASISTKADEKGEFDIRAFPKGTTELSSARPAADGGREVSETYTFEAADDSPHGPVVLTLQKNQAIRGKVLAATGPVIGATVSAWPTSGGDGVISTVRSRLDGTFEIKMPAGTQAVQAVVSPPGGALKAYEMNVSSNAELMLPVEPLGGDVIVNLGKSELADGGTLAVWQDDIGIPLGTLVHNVELQPGKGGQLCRSAGTLAQLLAKEGDHANIKLPSGEVRQVKLDCMATIGQVGNLDHENVSIGKAGRVRWKGFRPTVRGTVMNPVDHPMGGGEGKGKGNHPMTPWGRPTKGYKTRRGARPSDRYIVTRRTK